MINMYYNKNRVIGSVCTTHGAQATMHAVQHMPHNHKIRHHYPHVGYTQQSIYPMGFTPISFY
ncbi:hypothetical protein V6946_13670 [Bacillus sp. PPSBB_2]